MAKVLRSEGLRKTILYRRNRIHHHPRKLYNISVTFASLTTSATKASLLSRQLYIFRPLWDQRRFRDHVFPVSVPGYSTTSNTSYSTASSIEHQSILEEYERLPYYMTLSCNPQ
jgi:hypothetical protein